MQAYLLVADITDDARVVLLANHATIQVLHEKAPHVELVTLHHNAVCHGKHPETHAVTYTLNEKSGDGICLWDTRPTSCQLYRWNERNPAPVFTGLLPAQLELRKRVSALCKHFDDVQKVPWGAAWDAQQDMLDEWQATLLQVVYPLLPDDILAMVEPVMAKRCELDQGL